MVLSPRVGFTGLTNRACEAWDEKNECTNWVVQEWKLSDAKTRDLLRKLGFVCNVNGKHYRICADEAALCRNTYHCDGLFCSSHKKKTEVVPWEPDFQRAAGTRCASQDSYPFEELR